MKSNLLNTPCLALIALMASSSALAGSSAGNGVDLHGPYYSHAWFGGLDSQPTYCLSIAAGFGVSEAESAGLVEWAFQAWVDYLRLKGLSGPGSTYPVLLARTLKRVTSCSSADLRIHFGTTDSDVEKLKKGYSNPIAFSEKTQYDASKGWGKGVLWVSSPFQLPSPAFSKLDWTDRAKLKGVLLHEMGHIFGTEHVDGTIMDKELGYRVLNEGGPSGGALNLPLETIDSRSRELVSCWTKSGCDYVFRENGHAQLQTRFEKLTGKPAVGKVSAVVQVKEGPRRKKSGQIILTDAVSSHVFQFEVEKLIVWRNGNGNAFRYQVPISMGPSSSGIGTGSGSYFGYMISATGSRTPISYTRNMSYSLEIVDLDGEVLQGKEDDSDFFHGHSFEVAP